MVALVLVEPLGVVMEEFVDDDEEFRPITDDQNFFMNTEYVCDQNSHKG